MQGNSLMSVRLQIHLFAANVHLEPFHQLRQASAFYVQQEVLQVQELQSVFGAALDDIQQKGQQLGLKLVWSVWLELTQPTALLLAYSAVQVRSPYRRARTVFLALQASIPAQWQHGYATNALAAYFRLEDHLHALFVSLDHSAYQIGLIA